MKFATIEEAVKDIREGKFVIVVDDESRENEGDLVIAAEKADPEKINFMLKNARGILCVPLTAKRLDELKIPLMVDDRENTEITGCAFTVSVDYKKGTTTGVSADDRCATINALINPKSKPEDFARPGHIFPLRAKDDGVLDREGHTEAAIDMAKLAGLYPAGVIIEIMNEDGSMAKLGDLEIFCEKHDLKLVKIGDIISYLKKRKMI